MHVHARRRSCHAIACLMLVGSALAGAADDGWQWVNPLPQGNWLEAVWVAPGGEAFAVGDWGTILAFDGATWSSVAAGITTSGFKDTWGSSAEDVFAVGSHGTIVHYDGTLWTVMDSATQRDLMAVWGASAGDVWAAGEVGTMVHFDGLTWSPVSGVGEETIQAIWGSSGSDVFAVGRSGTILHFDGLAWSAMIEPASVNLSGFSAVWGSAPDNVYAAAAYIGYYSGFVTLWHYDGSSWSEVPEGRTMTGHFGGIPAIWGSAADDVWVVGTELSLHFDGSAWELGGPRWCADIAGRAADDVWAVSEQRLLHFGGDSWTEDNPATTFPLFDVWGSSATDVYALGWKACSSIYCSSPGWEGAIKHFDGIAWHEVTSLEGWTYPNAVWGSSAGDVFVVGSESLVLHFDGATWTDNSDGLPENADLVDVWGSAADDVYALSRAGVVYHRDGSGTWHEVAVSGLRLVKLWGSSADDVWAVGSTHGDPSSGAAYHFDGVSWSSVALPVWSPPLTGVWGSSSTDVFATSENHVILHFDGRAWNTMVIWTTRHLSAIWGTSASDVYAVGGSSILHFDGASWSNTSSPAEWGLSGVWGSSADDVYVIGGEGTILHYGDREATVLVPGAASASGEGGSRFATALEVHNPGPAAAAYQLVWLPRGRDNATPLRTASTTLAAGHTDRYDDVLVSAFGLTEAVGAVAVAATPDALVVTSRTAAAGTDGSYGQELAGVAPGDLIGPGERRRLIFLAESDAWRSNLGLANASHRPLTVRWQSYAGDGIPLGSGSVELAAFANTQVHHVLGAGPVDAGYVDVWTDTAETWFTAYASVLDNGSSDPTTVLPVRVVPSSSSLIPAAARIAGYHGAFFTTELEVHNPGAAPAAFTLTFLPRTGSEADPVTSAQFHLEPGKSARYRDVLASVFSLPEGSAGAVRVATSPATPLLVMSRTATAGAGGSFGQAFAGIPESSLLREGRRHRIPFLAENDDFRTNLGLVNGSDRPVVIHWAAIAADGTAASGGSVELPGFGSTQLNRFLAGSAPLAGAAVDVWSDTPDARFTAYASLLDNGSSDPITLSPR